MSVAEDPEVIECESEVASEEDVFYKEWGKESLKRSLPFVNDVLQRLLTLNTTLIAGSFLLRDDALAAVWRIGAAFCFLTSLTLCLLGMLPYARAFSVYAPREVQKHTEAALRVKRRWLSAAAFALVLGFLVAIGGLVGRCVHSPQSSAVESIPR